ncbi:BamA/TamA family outer membrane protein [uncultured Bacteroides sp.]|uniref:translocation and assembly module lipoprotein TamL n=1 Tax=uncultured Bacteroides sp. TaxID=162156 RepID=UPI00260709B6|nr:BamA/TamA family outer membrane protein [uncultured Bacteroides sp.]
MKKPIRIFTNLMLASLLVSSCSVNKFIPEGHYLLDAVKVESDNKEIKPSEMNLYVRQTPNAKWFSVFKLPLYIYGASGLDSTKWINRLWRRLGDAPVIYDKKLADETREEILKAVQNRGYMGATVDLQENPNKKKMKLRYIIRTSQPYIVNHISYDIPDFRIREFLVRDSASTLLHPGMRFDVNVLEAERQRITQILQNEGYYRFNKDFINFQADTMRYTHKVDLSMILLPYRRKKEDLPEPHKQYRLRNVNYLLNTDLFSFFERTTENLDSITRDGVNLYFEKKPFLRPRVLTDYNYLVPGQLYSSKNVQDTYTSLSRLHVLKYSTIRFNEVEQNDSTYLDAYISLSKNKNKSLSFEVEGTNSAGDLGAAASVSYTHRNLFHGSEAFTIKLRGAYEAVSGLDGGYANSNYTEYGVESSLNFPEFKFPFLSKSFKRRIKATSEVSLKYNWQIRPEFERTLAAGAWSYRWTRRGKATHRLDLLDVNYIYMPYTSQAFRDYLNRMDEVNPLLRHSYEDLLIVRLGYTYTYNSSGSSAMKTAKRNSYSIRVNIEESGNLLYAFSKIFHPHPKSGKAYNLANIDFAQYIKADFDYAKNFMIDERNSLVIHGGLGIAYPYGNSKSLPFEKLYFSGGANSVRGWRVRSLGPGSYHGDSNTIDYVNHTGDIKLDLNIEYRTFLFWKLHGAAFIDAGNIWNLRRQGNNDSGLFKFNRFYKQLAVAYGLGIRFDLDFLILRFDAGMKAVNPALSGKDKYPLISPRLRRDFAFHFAVGYPF